jgi:multiple sugar transport system permease protein
MKKTLLEKIILTVLTILVVLFFMIPIYWLITNSFKFGRDAIAIPPKWFVFDFTLKNYYEALTQVKTTRFILNSVIITTGATLLSLMVPPVAMLIPFYLIMRDVQLLGTYAAVIILDTVFDASFVVWMMRSYFSDVPREMEEAALVDGASHLGAFLKVALPLSVPGIVASALYVIIYSWNDFLFALMLTSPKTKTIPLGILASFSAVEIGWGRMAAMSVFAIIPAVIISLFLNRYFVQGLTLGATKG